MTNTVTAPEVKPKFSKRVFSWYLENGFGLVSLRGKRPAESGDRRFIQKLPSVKAIMKGPGYNIGAEVPADIVVIDVDPRNGGDESARALVADLFENSTFHDLLCDTFVVQTGGGGWHLYFRLNDPGKLAGSLKHYGPGIDIKKSPGGYVVTPGSIHPDTGAYYEILENGYELDPQPLPAEIKDLLLTPIVNPLERPLPDASGTRHPLWGIVSPGELAALLAPLDPVDHRDYNSHWFPLLCAAHHATGGDPQAAAVFADWSAGDPEYTGEAHKAVEAKWGTARERRSKGDDVATVRSILTRVKEARELAELLGNADQAVPPDVLDNAASLRLDVIKRISSSELETLDQSSPDGIDEAKNTLDWIEALPPGWDTKDPHTMRKLIDRVSHLDELNWPTLAGAIASACSAQITTSAILRLIKRQAKKRKDEDPPTKLTHAKIVSIASQRAIKAIAGDPKNLAFPPNGQPYLYKNGYWSKQHPATLSKTCYSQLKAFVDLGQSGTRPLPAYTKDSFSSVALERTTESTDLYSRRELPSCVNLENGTLWIANDGATELKPHRRDDLLTTKLPYSYDPDARTDGIDIMLRQVFDHVTIEFDNKERDEIIRHFWELVGYAIQPKKDIPKIMIWTGEGKNGKTRISKIISRLVGDDAWLSTSIASFFDPRQPHNTTSAEGKLLLVDDDVKINAVIRDGDLKRFSKEDTLQVNPKGRDHYTIRVQLVPLIITNNKMMLHDTSYGFTRRLDVIEWNTNLSHLDKSALPDEVEANQMPGVLNRAIQGLARLRKRGGFDLPACVETYNSRFIARSNNVIGFWVSLSKTKDPRAEHPTRDLYEAYRYHMRLDPAERPTALPGFVDTIRRRGVDINADSVKGWRFEAGI